MIEQCQTTDPRSKRCIYVKEHGGDCRYPNVGEGDLSNEIRLRQQLDDALSELELMKKERNDAQRN